jgi:hypothetical protein
VGGQDGQGVGEMVCGGGEVSDKDITDQVEFMLPDEELLPINKCACGKEFDWWEFVVSVYREDAHECDNCGRKMYFTQKIQVWEVDDRVQD